MDNSVDSDLQTHFYASEDSDMAILSNIDHGDF